MRQFSLTEAKAKLSELLDMVEAGDEIVIMRHGVAVARLSRAVDDERRRKAREAVEALRSFPRVELPPGMTVKDLINEGRKY